VVSSPPPRAVSVIQLHFREDFPAVRRPHNSPEKAWEDGLEAIFLRGYYKVIPEITPKKRFKVFTQGFHV